MCNVEIFIGLIEIQNYIETQHIKIKRQNIPFR